MQAYSNPKRANDPWALPDIEVFQLTAEEAVQQDEDLMLEASKQFPLMHMNSRDRQKAIDWAIEQSGCTGGWFWWSCLPGCMPDGSAIGPFDTREEALADAQQDAAGHNLREGKMTRSTYRVWFLIKGEHEMSASLVSAKDENEAIGKVRELLAKESTFATFPKRPEKL